MNPNKNTQNKSFETSLFESLKKHGLLFPVNDEQVDSFEKEIGKTEIELPAKFRNAETFIKKEAKVVPILANNIEPSSYRKVAAAKKTKKK
jgi:hypothetical protein